MNKAKLTVIIPCYNGEKLVGKAISSVLNQHTAKIGIEVLVINDGSTDRSVDIVNEFCSNNPNVRLISQQNQGLSAARNTGIINSSGDYVLFLDADDFMLPDCLETLCLKAAESKADMVRFDTRFAHPDDYSIITPPQF